MTGLFAQWQPRYAAHGVATFPLVIEGKEKRPAVKHYQRIGLKGSEQLAMKFEGVDAFAFMAGKRSRISVVDIDAPDDEDLLRDVLHRYGDTPLITRTGSGGFHCYYRHNGEGRKVRPDPTEPVDMLGGGVLAAPPSMGGSAPYQFIRGNLDDFDRLPVMKAVNLPEPPAEAVQEPDKETDAQSDIGTRNDALWRGCMKAAKGCHKIEELMENAMTMNASLCPPLPADEVLKIVASAWGYECEGKNWFGIGGRVVFAATEVDDIAASEPHAYALLGLLRRHHWGRDFILAKAYADHLGWTQRRFKAARDVLLSRQLIICVHAGGKGPNDPPVYRFP